MKSSVYPELPTATLRSSQATHAAVDNSVPSAISPESTYKSGKAVQTNGATSLVGAKYALQPPIHGIPFWACRCPPQKLSQAQSSRRKYS